MRYCKYEEAECPKDYDICCHDCTESCEARCALSYKHCGECEERGIDTFEDKAALAIRTVSDITLKKKELEEVEKEMKASILKAMEQYGIKKFENEVIRITYVEPTTRTSIDSKKLKSQYPDIAEECEKVSQVKAGVRITVK